MRMHWIAAVLASACVFSLSTGVFAADLRLEQEPTTAAAVIYNYQPLRLNAAGRAQFGNTLYCTAQERLYGRDGKIYRLADASPLSDSGQFRAKIQLLVNAPAVKTLKLAKGEQALPERTSFVLTLADDWLYRDVTVKFQVTYTAVTDTTLSVLPAGTAGSAEEMAVAAGEQIEVAYTLRIDDEALFAGNYDGYELRPARYEQVILPSDPDFPAGPEEVILTPEKNQDADLTWADVGKLVAQVNFGPGSLESAPKLSARWEDTGLAGERTYGGCYARVFVGSPQPDGGEVTLVLTNPFLTEKGEETVPHSQVNLYEIRDGQPVEITRQARYGTDSDGNGAFLLSTSSLGSYVLTDQPLK